MVTGVDHAWRIADRIRDAGFGEVFVIGGDHSPPPDGTCPQQRSSMTSRRGSLVCRLALRYPEGHPLIAPDRRVSDLAAKQPLVTTITTQLCFDADVIARWIGSIRAAGVSLPVLVGVPGVVDRRGSWNVRLVSASAHRCGSCAEPPQRIAAAAPCHLTSPTG